MRRVFPWVTALVVCFAMPALGGAAEWEFYGSSRMATFWTETDYGDSLGPSGSKDDADLVFTQQTESRIGANVKAGNISGRFEYGSAPNLRILWGEWDFGAGKLGVGQNYSPVNIFKSNQVWDDDVGLLYSGGVYGARRDMIRLRFGPVDFALVEVNDAGLVGYAVADTDVKIPKLEARYLLSKDSFSFEIGGGYQTYDVVDAADKEESVDAWVVYLGVDYAVGPVLLMGNVYTGQNTGNYDLLELGQNMALWNGTKVVDNDTFGFVVSAGYKLSDRLTFEAGYGYLQHELDQKGARKDDNQAYYLQAVISLAKGVSIVPEIGVIDYMKDAGGNDEGKLTYFGAKWQIDF